MIWWCFFCIQFLTQNRWQVLMRFIDIIRWGSLFWLTLYARFCVGYLRRCRCWQCVVPVIIPDSQLDRTGRLASHHQMGTPIYSSIGVAYTQYFTVEGEDPWVSQREAEPANLGAEVPQWEGAKLRWGREVTGRSLLEAEAKCQCAILTFSCRKFNIGPGTAGTVFLFMLRIRKKCEDAIGDFRVVWTP